ncbi:uncharacterized protein [Rutidosis leptorrhynchoides]|uniref:uncharacterized protein n=1 Tax=Rutidosis leptorrhynchoides TaxID=125765 RepID=UPI003A993FD0
MKGLKKCSTNVNLGTKQKPMKVCSCKKKNKGVDKQGGYLVDEPVLDKNINKSPNVYKVPLKEEDHKSWLEFKELAKEMPIADRLTPMYFRGWPIKVDHPFVAVIRDFTIAAFNEVIQMYVKKNRENNSMSHPEVMKCTFINRDDHYFFYMEMEAIEEGILGVYHIAVACDYNNGTTTLLQKILVDTTPTGKIATLLPRLNSLKSDYKTFIAVKKDIEIKLERVNDSMIKGKVNEKVAAPKLIHLKKKYTAIRGKCELLYREIESQIPKGWSKRSAPRDIVDDGPYRGLIKKRHGYDYYVCSPGFSIYQYIG